MKINAVSGTMAVSFLFALLAAYHFGKAAGVRQGLDSDQTTRDGLRNLSGSGSTLSGLGPGVERPGEEKNASDDPAAQRRNIKSIIAKARAKMQGGMMNTSAMMRALAMLDQIPDDQLVAALEEVDRSIKEPQQKMMFAMLLLGRWAESDGPAALAYADEHFSSKNPMMAGMRMSVVSSWAQSDPEAAWDWYQKDEGENSGGGMFGGKSMALMGIIGSMANKDVDAAFDRMVSLEDPGERMMAMQGFGQAVWDEDKREIIMAKLETIEDAAEKQQMRASVLQQWSQIDPDGALEWAGGLEDSERSTVVMQIAQSMTWSDPERAGDLMLSAAKTEQERQQAYSNTVSSWAYSDPYGAGEWLANQDQGPELDQARQQFANAVTQKDPDSAMAWANAVTDADTRGQAVQNVYVQWAGKDRGQADAALEKSDLSDEKIAAIKAVELPKVGAEFGAFGSGAMIGVQPIRVDSDIAVPVTEVED